MDKEILKILLSKKLPFLDVWCWLYANSDSNGIVCFDYNDIMIECRVPKTIIFRSLELQRIWNKNNAEKTIMLHKRNGEFVPMYCEYPAPEIMEQINERKTAILKQKRNNIRLIIMFITPLFETVLKQIEEKIEPQKEPKKPRKKSVSQKVAEEFNENNNENKDADKKKPVNPRSKVDSNLLKKCLAIYIQFYKKRNDNATPLIDGMQVNALKDIILHFMKNSPDPSEENIIHSFDILFNNWDKYANYIQDQLTLIQIKRNITNMVAYLKKNRKNINKDKTSRLKDFQDAIIDKVNSGDMEDFLSNLGKN